MCGKNRDLQRTSHVAPNGSDANSGTEAEPFKTIEKARDAVRAVNKNMTGDILILLRGGTYAIDRTIVFDHEDSGTNGHNVIYRSYPGEAAVISGGKRIAGWQPDSNGRWKASVDLDNFRQLYVNGRRAVRARGKVPAGLESARLHGYRNLNHEMAGWSNINDVEFCYYDSWCHTRCKLDKIQIQDGYAVAYMAQPNFTLAKIKEGRQVDLPDYVENAFELLSEPGEWYLNRATRTVYYIPRPEEDMQAAEVVAPVLEKLIELRGTLDHPAHNIQFEGVTFSHATWLRPSEVGHVDVQANFTVGPDTRLFVREDSAGMAALHMELKKSPSNVVCHAAKSIRLERCTFTKLGGGGIDLEYGAQDNVISGCEFHDISGTAIQIGDVQRDDHHPEDDRLIVKNNTVTNCYIHDVAVEYMGGVGIFAGYTQGTVISHNEMCNLPYSAVSVGWGWGETDAGGGAYYQPSHYDTPTSAGNNRIEYNHIYHVMQVLNDGGGVYTLGRQPGTVIRGNHIHDNPEGPGGVYLDEGSAGIEVTGNVVHNTKFYEYRGSLAMCFNNKAEGRDKTCNVHDNCFDVKPDDSDFPKSVAESAGLESACRDLLQAQRQEQKEGGEADE